MNVAALPAYDVLAIPDNMQTYEVIMMGISVAVFAFLFTLSILTENVNAVSGEKPNYRKLIWRAILIICSLAIYRHIFIKTVAICEAIAMSLFSLEDFYAFKTLLASQYDKIPTTVLTTSIQNIIASLFVYIAITIESVLQLFRYMLLSALYIIGPLALTMNLWKPTSSITRGWFLTLLQLSFWIITLRVLEATMLSLNVTSIISNGGTAEYVLMSALVITLVAMTPSITASLITGSHISMVGGIAMASFAAVSTKWGGHAANISKLIGKSTMSSGGSKTGGSGGGSSGSGSSDGGSRGSTGSARPQGSLPTAKDAPARR